MKKIFLRFGLTAFLLTFSFSILLQGTYYFNQAVQASLLVQDEDEEEEEDPLQDDLFQDAKDEFRNIQKKLKFRDRQIQNIKAGPDAISEAQTAFSILQNSSAQLNEALEKGDGELFFDLKSDFDEKDSELEDLIEELVKGHSSKRIEAFIAFKKQQFSEMQKALDDFQKAENENGKNANNGSDEKDQEGEEGEEGEENESGKEILAEGGKIIQDFSDAINVLQEEYGEAESDAETLEMLADDLGNRNPAFEEMVQKFGKLTGQAAAFRRLEKKMKKVEEEAKKEPKKKLRKEPKKKIAPIISPKKIRNQKTKIGPREEPGEEPKFEKKKISPKSPKKRSIPGKNVSKIRSLVK